jgi:hypothetical protein
MSRNRIIGIGGAFVLAVIIGGSIIGTVAANTVPAASDGAALPAAPSSSPSSSPKPVAAGTYCETYRAAYAAALGVDVEDLAPAAAKAAQAAIDAAVADGHLSAARAEKLKARIAASDAGGCEKFLERIGTAKPERPTAGVVKDGVEAVAKTLGMTSAELRAELRSGKDLKAIAAEKSVPYATVTAAALAPVKARLDAAVAAGKLTQARADKILAKLEQSLADGRFRPGRPAAPTTPGG